MTKTKYNKGRLTELLGVLEAAKALAEQLEDFTADDFDALTSGGEKIVKILINQINVLELNDDLINEYEITAPQTAQERIEELEEEVETLEERIEELQLEIENNTVCEDED